MNVKGVEKTLGRSKGWERAGQDTDRDGVVNSLDCEPYNSKKQGIIHDYVERWKAKRAGIEESKIRQYQQERKKREFKIRAEAKKEQRERYIREKEKIKTDRKIKYAREGGFMGQVGRVASNVSRPTPKTPTRRRTKKKKKRAKVKRAKVRTRYTKQQPMPDITSDKYRFI